MADDGATVRTVRRKPSASQVVGYIEQMLLELAAMASDAQQTALAASLALVAIQAGAGKERMGAENRSG